MDSHCNIRRLRVPRGGPLDAAPAPRDLRRMNKRRIFIIVVVALAAAAAMLRAHPSAPAERDVVALAEPTPAAGRTASSAQLVVYVAGAVVRSGVYRMPACAWKQKDVGAA